jgi:hypothetical protein
MVSIRRGGSVLSLSGRRRQTFSDPVALYELANGGLSAIVVSPYLRINGIGSGLRGREDLKAFASGVLQVAYIVGRGAFSLHVGIPEGLKLLRREGIIDVDPQSLGNGPHLAVNNVVGIVAAVACTGR